MVSKNYKQPQLKSHLQLPVNGLIKKISVNG